MCLLFVICKKGKNVRIIALEYYHFDRIMELFAQAFIDLVFTQEKFILPFSLMFYMQKIHD